MMGAGTAEVTHMRLITCLYVESVVFIAENVIITVLVTKNLQIY